jgi:hypothetical protein
MMLKPFSLPLWPSVSFRGVHRFHVTPPIGSHVGPLCDTACPLRYCSVMGSGRGGKMSHAQRPRMIPTVSGNWGRWPCEGSPPCCSVWRR